MNRRSFLKLGAVASGTFAVGGFGRAWWSTAAAQPAGIPTVDRLAMTNVVDNVYDIFVRAGDTLLAEHGLAYHLESTRGSERREILLDFSLTERNLANNYRALTLDPGRADALILSHGHVDHYGALAPLVAQGIIKPGLTLYAGGEDTFCQRVVAMPTATIDTGQLDRAGLEARGLKVVLAKQASVVAGQAMTTGQIERLTDFEKPPAAGRVIAGAMDSACASTHFGTTQVAAKPGELVFVVITSCGHAGVITSVRQAQKAAGVQKIHAIVGGFHLAPAPDEVVAKTVEAFKAIDPDYVIPAHCTGMNTIMAVYRAMPQKLVMPSTGTRVIFGA